MGVLSATYMFSQQISLILGIYNTNREGKNKVEDAFFEKMFKDQGLFDQQISINCKAGDMVLFPADVPHHVEAHQLESPRISIAMNLAFVLNWQSLNKMIELNCK